MPTKWTFDGFVDCFPDYRRSVEDARIVAVLVRAASDKVRRIKASPQALHRFLFTAFFDHPLQEQAVLLAARPIVLQRLAAGLVIGICCDNI